MSLAKSWFSHTFPSRARTEELLHPDLDSGLITQHDFSLAVDFLPGHHRYLPPVNAVVWGAVTSLLLFRFKPKFRFHIPAVGVAGSVGYGVGLASYFRAHDKFARQLDDRQAFLLVLENVNRRLGNPAPLFPQLDTNKILEDVVKRKEERGEFLSPAAELLGETSPASPENPPPERPPMHMRAAPTPVASDASAARPKSAWDAIRDANAQNAGRHSAWEELRQRHERQRVADRVPVQRQSAPELEDPRAQAQAEFDAILEAERRAARG